MAYDAKAVANYFLELAAKDGVKISPMKIQKLIFYAHGWHLGLLGKPLISDEIEAWQYGPVVPSIYREFRDFGSGPIMRAATDVDFEFDIVAPEIPPEDETARSIIDRVWKGYGRLSAVDLSNLTHRVDSPWSKAIKANPGLRNVTISDASIAEHFQALVAKQSASK